MASVAGPQAPDSTRTEPDAIEARTQYLGRALFRLTERYHPSPLEAVGDQAMALLADDPRFRARLLRFIDALAGLDGDRTGTRVRRLLHEYLDADFRHVPLWLRALIPILRSERWPAPMVAAVARMAARTIAARFIASGGAPGALKALAYLRAHGRYPSFDVLGEYVASETEADAYRDQYLELIRVLGRGGSRQPAAGRRGDVSSLSTQHTAPGTTPGGVAALQVSLKLSSLTANFNPIDPVGTLARVRPRLAAIAEAARRHGIGLTLDMERYETRDLAQRCFFEVFGPGSRFGDWDGIGVVVQAYLRDAEAQADGLIAFARERSAPFQVRLVKGAYWDYETVVARANGWPVPVWEDKAETDLTFERLCARLLDAYPRIRLAVGSHNLRSHAYAEAQREAHGLPAAAVEHQTLFRTAEGVTRALAAMGWPVRDYVPLGELLPGMAYLVRRILENSSQAGFLLQSRTGRSAAVLLAPPKLRTAHCELRVSDRAVQPAPDSAFRNMPPRRLFVEEEREAFARALETVRAEFGHQYPLRLGGDDVRTPDVTPVMDPSHPDAPPLGFVHNAGIPQVARALEITTAAVAGWAARPVSERAVILRRAAALLAERRDQTAAWIVHEAAKSWPEALADVDEAIDYLRYYTLIATERSARGAQRSYRPRGVVAVIPPWNFPIAIPCGMTAAALVTGNAVLLKPAEQTPIVARRLVDVLHEAGVPEDVLIWLPGPGEQVGAALVASPLVDMVAFTGSRAVGTLIHREGTRVQPARGGLRATVAEMGGKNPIVVFPDADLDEAVVGILISAFGHANQKCSAASRVLIHRDIYGRLCRRLVEGAASLPSGPADDPGTVITPLIDAEARARVEQAAATARAEGRLLLDDLARPGPALGPELVEIPPSRAATARTTQEEIFGPVLALIPFRDEQEAVRIANNTSYALTGGIFSRSPGTVQRMTAALDVGNLYVNRPITGARVGVEPFGGHRLSGTGPKAGGSEYLWAFVTSRAGYRPDGLLPSGADRLAEGAVQPWADPPSERGDVVRAARATLNGEWRDRWQAAHPGGDAAASVRMLDHLLERLPEIAAPQPTVPLPGQQTAVRWDTPRGCGLVIVDSDASTANLVALIIGALMAGNGVIIVPDRQRRRLVELLLAALQRAGLPAGAARLAPEGFDIAAAVALPRVTFAAVDLGEGAARQLYRLLGDASATPEAPYLKALIALADGPAPDEPGFLRRFALPKTVAVRTLHLGADLELVDGAGV
jgi:RHH-type proline utilization regulon transcriptional repressor/proline dehydrogenase/delta 1-pyrroline-5-carboxylate dehydrogenase